VWGAIGLAKKIGAKTVLLCFNPSIQIEKAHRPDVVIAPNLGPEILTGSTRLKSGTATKIVLNMLSTIAMVRMGKVIGNLMVDLNPSNIKLRDRAIRILQDLTDCSSDAAENALERSGWVVKDAWVRLKKRKL
jgi:N-acetylmuramic acid 6-phosphate (MurNAc-6-P) etherase